MHGDDGGGISGDGQRQAERLRAPRPKSDGREADQQSERKSETPVFPGQRAQKKGLVAEGVDIDVARDFARTEKLAGFGDEIAGEDAGMGADVLHGLPAIESVFFVVGSRAVQFGPEGQVFPRVAGPDIDRFAGVGAVADIEIDASGDGQQSGGAGGGRNGLHEWRGGQAESDGQQGGVGKGDAARPRRAPNPCRTGDQQQGNPRRGQRRPGEEHERTQYAQRERETPARPFPVADGGKRGGDQPQGRPRFGQQFAVVVDQRSIKGGGQPGDPADGRPGPQGERQRGDERANQGTDGNLQQLGRPDRWARDFIQLRQRQRIEPRLPRQLFQRALSLRPGFRDGVVFAGIDQRHPERGMAGRFGEIGAAYQPGDGEQDEIGRPGRNADSTDHGTSIGRKSAPVQSGIGRRRQAASAGFLRRLDAVGEYG